MCTFLAKIHKNRKGFTLAEVLIVVAIMSILAGFGFVAVSNYNKMLTLTEMDDTAKKIFLAAQNHLTIADANGEWKQLVNEKGTSIGDENCPTLGQSYYVIFGGKDTNSIADDVRKVMLPDQSVNLAGDGRYAIIFNKDTAAVYGVYYSASSTFGNGQDKIDFAGTIKKDIEHFDSDSSLTKLDNRKVQNPLIGYYGNSNNVGTKKEENTDIKILQKLKVYFINSKELTLVIEDPNSDIYRPLDSKEQLTRDFYITIKTSENPGYSVNATIKNENFLTINNTILNFSNQNSSVTNGIVLKDKNNVPTHLSITPTYLAKGSTSSVNEDVYFITFDSLTAAGKHFINLFQTMKPGLDVTADVTMTVNQDGKVTSLGGSATDNSLFEQIYPGNGGYTARVSNVRHLENLSQEISGVDIVENGQQIKKAILTQNLDLDNDGYSIGTPIYASDGSRNKVLSADENFIGINVPKNSAFITFEGNKKTISNMRVVGAPFAASGESVGSGLFSSVNGDFSISNLTLEKPVVTGTTGESAGSVIGTFTGNSLSIKNLKVNGNSSTTVVDITGSKNAGGLVGSLNRVSDCAVQIKNCQIKGTRVHSESGNAGGLIGEAVDINDAAGSGTLTISNSKVVDPVALTANVTNADKIDIYAANGSAGGFIGTSGAKAKNTDWKLTIVDSEIYSDENYRFNVAAPNEVGGLIGGFYGNSLSISGTLVAGKYMWIQNLDQNGNINGSCAGGFIGENDTSSSVSIQNCGAGAYVYAEKADCAGGLVGSLKAKAASDIKNTYVSGHTNGGFYIDQAYDGTSEKSGGYNVFGYTSIGGFIGYTNANHLTVDNCSTSASVYTNAADEAANTSNAVIGGFIGRTAWKPNIKFSNCYVAGKVYTNGNNFNLFGGSFIGSIQNGSKGYVTTDNEFVHNFVLSGTLNDEDFNNVPYTGAQTTNYVTNAKDLLSKGITKVSTTELKAKVVVGKTDAKKTFPYDAALVKSSYPYPLTVLLPNYEDNGKENGNRRYFGDWAEPEESKSKSFDGDYGIIYYEKVQHGEIYKPSTPDSFYYHGYVGYLKDEIPEGHTAQYTEVNTTDTIKNPVGTLDDHGLIKNHDEFVVEQGYFILVKDEQFDSLKKYLRLSYLNKRKDNSSAQTLEKLIEDQYLAEDVTKNYAKNLNIRGYKLFYINPDKDFEALNIDETQLAIFYSTVDHWQEGYEEAWNKRTEFAFNPIFSDISISNRDTKDGIVVQEDGKLDVSKTIFKIRSVQSLYKFISSGWIDNNWQTSAKPKIRINLDINCSPDVLDRCTQFNISDGIPKKAEISETSINSIYFDLQADNFNDDSSDRDNYNYSIDHLHKPISNSINSGSIRNFYIKNCKLTEDKSVFGSMTVGGKINNVQIDYTNVSIIDSTDSASRVENLHVKKVQCTNSSSKSLLGDSKNDSNLYQYIEVDLCNVPIFNNVQGRFQDIHVKEFDIHGDVGSLIFDYYNGSKGMDKIVVEKTTIYSGAKVGAKDDFNGFFGNINGETLHDVTISNVTINNNVTLAGNYWGIVGRNGGKVYDMTISNIQIDSSLGNHNFAIIGKNEGTVNGTYNGEKQKITVETYTTPSYGFVIDNAGTIENVTISDADIGESGFVKTNGLSNSGTIKNCHIIDATVKDSGFVETNNQWNSKIASCDLKNVICKRNGFAGTVEAGTSIENCSVINAYIRQTGFVETNRGTVTGCQIYSNGTTYQSNNSRIVFVLGQSASGYDSVCIGGYPGMLENDYVGEADGFVHTNENAGVISKCSVSGRIYGQRTASGFANEVKSEIQDCYANVILTASGEVDKTTGQKVNLGEADGFCKEMMGGWNRHIIRCHATGKIEKAYQGAGFAGGADNGVRIEYCYTALWEVNATEYCYFIYAVNNNQGNITNCLYLKDSKLAINGKETDWNGNALSGVSSRGAERLKDCATDSNYGAQSAGDGSYHQYWINASSYPYPTPSGLIEFGDWWEDNSQSVTATAGAKANIFNVRSSSVKDSQNVISSDAEALQSEVSVDESESATESESVGYLTPAGISSETQPDIVTKKHTVKRKAS